MRANFPHELQTSPNDAARPGRVLFCGMDQPDQSDAAARFPFDAVYKANAHYNMDLSGLEELLAMEDVTVLSSRLDETPTSRTTSSSVDFHVPGMNSARCGPGFRIQPSRGHF